MCEACAECKITSCGDGEGRNHIQDKVKKLGLEDKVIFTGVCNDVADLLSAMDVFVFHRCMKAFRLL